MGEIKSALELALERTNSVQSDKKLILKNSVLEDGRKTAFKYVEDDSANIKSIEEKLKAADKEQEVWLKEGMLKVFLSNLKLPEDEAALIKTEKIQEAIKAISKNKKEIIAIFAQVKEIFVQYIKNRYAIKQNLDAKFAQKLQAKEQLLSQQLGAEIHLTPENDPEYKEYLNKTNAQLNEKFHEILVEVKEEIEKRV